jgi:arylsulfatase A-like enzyme
MRTPALLVLLLVTSVSTGLAAAPTNPSVRPNVVFFVIDDLGYGDLACYGNPHARTPHIDRLARDGVRFTQAYAPSPVCSSSRASFFTGMWPARIGLTDAIGDAGDRWNRGRRLRTPPNPDSLPHRETTLAEVFREAGYTTASIGKWHLGDTGSLPEDHGFSVNFSGNNIGSHKSMFGPDYGIGLPPAPEGEHLAERVQAEAEAFVRQHRNTPFFLHVGHYSVHRPVGARPQTIARYPARGPAPWGLLPEYAAMIEEMDATIGRMMQFLREDGLEDRTIVVFISDNGAVQAWGSNGGLRGTKGTLREGGIRVPLIVRLPGHVGAGRGIETPVHGCDLFPTLVDLAGIARPENLRLDGVSLRPLLESATNPLPERPLFWHFPHYNMHGSTPTSAVRLGRLKLLRFYESGRDELYDLEADPGETTDLAAAEPGALRRLAERLGDHLVETGAQMPTLNPRYAFADPELRELLPFESTRTRPQP